MGSNSWLAIDVGTAPTLRARELRFAWERFVAALGRSGEEEGDPDDVREPIVDSWRRSAEAGIDPTGHQLAPVLADEDEAKMLWQEHPLARMAPLIHECLGAIADEAAHPIVITDANGMLLSVEGSARLRLRAAAMRASAGSAARLLTRAAETMSSTEGTHWSEPAAGTNAIGTAIAAEHA